MQQWQARVDVEHAASQHRVPEEELSTDGYTTLGASLGYNFDLGESRWLAFVKGTNLTNQTVRYASSILRDRVPAADGTRHRGGGEGGVLRQAVRDEFARRMTSAPLSVLHHSR